jgi:hypothetical protein
LPAHVVEAAREYAGQQVSTLRRLLFPLHGLPC